MDNIFTECLLRTVKYENVYLMHYGSVPEGKQGINSYFGFYNDDRPQQSLKDQTRAEVSPCSSTLHKHRSSAISLE